MREMIHETKTFLSYLHGALPFVTDPHWNAHITDQITKQTQLLQQLEQGVRI